jgi:hypothetical protein
VIGSNKGASVSALGSWVFVRLILVSCALMLTWLCAQTCAAQHTGTLPVFKTSFDLDARSTARTELANFDARPSAELQTVSKPISPWLIAAASTTAAFAASYAISMGFSYRNSAAASRAMERSRDVGLDLDMRLRLTEQGTAAQAKADLLARVSDICVAGAVMSAGTTLLIWLTGKRKNEEKQMRTLIGPMVLRGYNGAGLVARAKF